MKHEALHEKKGMCSNSFNLFPAQNSDRITIEYDRNFRAEFISDRNRLSDSPSEIRSDLISGKISDQLSD